MSLQVQFAIEDVDDARGKDKKRSRDTVTRDAVIEPTPHTAAWPDVNLGISITEAEATSRNVAVLVSDEAAETYPNTGIFSSTHSSAHFIDQHQPGQAIALENARVNDTSIPNVS
uniref:Uncharacterized protein n=1 Tax=Anopheles atroparvus TaxID=41427 RepID=A0A182JDC4_ANOAO